VKTNETRVNAPWLRLDNAAKLYPAIQKKGWSSVFRLSARMREKVDLSVLQKALEQILPRFPGFAVRMRRGVFWYYLEHNAGTPLVRPEAANPCRRMRWHENGGFLFRVSYYERRIALEVFHALCDGTGGMAFLKTLLARYQTLKGNAVPAADGVFDVEQAPRPEELEDAYARYATSSVRQSRREPKAYQVRGRRAPKNMLNIITGELDTVKALAAARGFGVTLTEYLVAVLIRALYLQQKSARKCGLRPVKVSVPVNLRRFFPTESVRNFSQYVNPGIDPNYGDYTFEEIAEQVHHFMRMNVNEKFLNARMAVNMASERNPLTRVMPLFIKKAVLALIFRRVGEALFTSTLTNLGAVRVPSQLAGHVERFEATLGPSCKNPVNCAAISFEDRLVVSFASTICETEVERLFFTQIVKHGVPVRIESNRT